MTPNDLLKLETELTENISILEKHFPEIPDLCYYIWNIEPDRLKIGVIKNHYFDHRRYWNLAVLKMDDIPIAFLQNAGREGDDHCFRFIINEDKFRECIIYLRSLKEIEFENNNTKILNDLDEDNEELTTFYGYSLNSKFDVWRY